VGGQPTPQETPPKSLVDFLYRVSKDERAQDGLCRLMRSAALSLLLLMLPITAIVLVTMPAMSPWLRGIIPASVTALIAIGTSVRRWLKKRASRRLPRDWRTRAAGGLIAAAQETDGRLRAPDGGNGQHGGHA
jgi:hypothetical protein